MKIDLANRQIWQQGSGDKNRSYGDLCVRWDVILNGPGNFGKWPDCIAVMEEERSSRKITDIRRFAEEIQSGDIVVLRSGTDSALAVGEVVGDYLWSDTFGDIDGWPLQHVRRVKWLWSNLEQPKTFKIYSLKQGDTTQLLMPTGEVMNWLTELEISEEKFERELCPLPLDWKENISIDRIAEYLYAKGVSSNSVNFLMSEFDELVRIASWYQTSKTNPSESETIAYLVVPLLRALGWSPQKMGIEWNRVDLALFKSLPRSDENLEVVVECKQMGWSCLNALSQAETYASSRPQCKRLIVTDGHRYGVFLKKKSGFVLYSYLNLTRLKAEYPVYEARGIHEALYSMTPEFNF